MTYGTGDDDEREAQERLGLLQSRMDKLAGNRDVLMNEAERLRGERDRLNSDHRETVDRLKEFRSRERQLKEEASALRDRMAAGRKAVASAREQTETMTEQIRQAKCEVRSKPEEVNGELGELNWELQTSPTNMAREKELMKRVKELSLEQQRHQKIGQLKLRLAEAQARRLGARLSMSRDWEKLRLLREAYEPLRQELLELSAKATAVRSKADEAHQRYLTKRASIDAVSAEMRKAALEMKALREQLQAKHHEEEKSRLKALAGEVKEKLGRGQKITFQELQVLSAEEEE